MISFFLSFDCFIHFSSRFCFHFFPFLYWMCFIQFVAGLFFSRLDKPMPIWIDVCLFLFRSLVIAGFLFHFCSLSLSFTRTISLSFACQFTCLACLVVQSDDDMTANTVISLFHSERNQRERKRNGKWYWQTVVFFVIRCIYVSSFLSFSSEALRKKRTQRVYIIRTSIDTDTDTLINADTWT